MGGSVTDFWLLDDNPWVAHQKFGRKVWNYNDGLHPNEAGYRLWRERLLPFPQQTRRSLPAAVASRRPDQAVSAAR